MTVFSENAFVKSNIEAYPVTRGKVRDIYDIGDKLVIVTTDRLSAFDYVLPTGIPGRGEILTQLTAHWLKWFEENNNCHHHMLPIELLPDEFQGIKNRCMVVKKLKMIPIECVVRGYISGSGWSEYQQNNMVCGVSLPKGLKESQNLNRPIFTPATKNKEGHDENIWFTEMIKILELHQYKDARKLATSLCSISTYLYRLAAEFAWERGIIIADTKFEFGHDMRDGEQHKLILADEVLTSDSSRFWALDEYCLGKSPKSFDKQFVRNYLSSTGWDRNSPPPELPEDVVHQTRMKYIEAYNRLIPIKRNRDAHNPTQLKENLWVPPPEQKNSGASEITPE